MAKGTILILVAAALVLVLLPADADAEGGSLLLDFGNGHTEWKDGVSGATLESAVSGALGDRISFSGGSVSVDGISEATVGAGLNRQSCGWRVYAWNSVEWEFLTMDLSERYSGGAIALGYYPDDSVVPVSSPDCRDVWTSFRGDSSSSGVSMSHGPERAASPLEWYCTYAGAVDASVLYADGMIYHTVAGKYGAVGMD